MERRHLAAASGHLHLAAAAYYMAKAAGNGNAASSPASSPISSVSSIDVPISSIDVGDGDSISIDVVSCGSASGGNVDDGEELEWTMQHLYDLLLLLASFVPPAPAYMAMPRDVVEGLAWTWIVLAYGVFLAVAVTIFSVRVFGTSSRCLPTFLRVLLLTATVVTEVLAAVYMMPATTLTVVGTCFSVLLLLAAHLIASRRHR